MNLIAIDSFSKPAPRQSNFELLRIIAMFLVLAVHANYPSLGAPSIEDFTMEPFASTTRVFMKALCIMCVNLFVLISGWFGIRPSIKGLANFMFQVLYFYTGTFILALIFGEAQPTVKNILACFGFSGGGWFVVAYLGLYAVAPILNLWTEKASKKQQATLLIAFFVFQTFYGNIGDIKFIASGYSTLSFIGLYLLSQFIRRYGPACYESGGVIFTCSLTLITLLGILNVYYPHSPNAFPYCSPLVIAEAVGFMLIFRRFNIMHVPAINFIAKSAFAAYLLHTSNYTWSLCYIPLCKYIYKLYNGVEYLAAIFAVLIGVFALALILDQPRKLLWKRFLCKLFTTKNNASHTVSI